MGDDFRVAGFVRRKKSRRSVFCMGIRRDMRKLIQTIYVDSAPRFRRRLGVDWPAESTSRPLGRYICLPADLLTTIEGGGGGTTSSSSECFFFFLFNY